MQDHDYTIGRFKVRHLMAEANLMSRQPGGHRDKRTGHAHADTRNTPDLKFDINRPDKVWCGDISSLWVGDRWH